MNTIIYLVSAAVINLAAIALFAFAMQRPAPKPVLARVRRNSRRL
ncbi:hypothetical protein CHELA20_52740 [Hyphomicrobiales bacterium]|nr:hypothetical protein CHELA41_22185 [Hyphomicrobiales bacterium]CAH1682778.1 hypothetical protein CHELA20_52740 [Hyphomicrobiales bacterium]